MDDVVVVGDEEWLPFISQDIIDRFELRKTRKLVAGGERRQDSVFCGIQALNGSPDIVAVHDAVRPFVSPAKISEVVEACQQYGAAILAVPPKDTVKVEVAGFVEQTPSRENLWCVQTPQAFKRNLLTEAYTKALQEGFYSTDDSALVEKLGHPVRIVEGEDRNFKITVSDDLGRAEIILRGGN